MTTYPRDVDCNVVLPRLDRYLAHMLRWDEALQVADHLEACVECSEQLVMLRATTLVQTRARDQRTDHGGSNG